MERALVYSHYYVCKKPYTLSRKQEAKALFDNVKEVVMGAHGAGEEARGKFNGFVDHAFHDDRGEQEDRAVAAKGHQQLNGLERKLDIEQKHGATSTHSHTQTSGAGSHFH